MQITSLSDITSGNQSPTMNAQQKVRLQNTQYQSNITGLLNGLPNAGSGVLSSSFLNSVYDAQLMSPQILGNYLKKVDEVLGDNEKPSNQKTTKDHQSFVDKMLQEKFPSSSTNTSEPLPSQNDEEVDSNSSKPKFYGIVGEIFDKYA